MATNDDQTYPKRQMRFGLWGAVAIALALLVSLAVTDQTGRRVTAAVLDVGYTDFAFGPGVPPPPTPTSGYEDLGPTGEKPQSKLWFNDGLWWGALLNGTTHSYDIYQFNWQAQTWTDTGTLIDGRSTAHPDCLWQAGSNSLSIASAVPPGDPGDTSIHVRRFTYDPTTRRYALLSDAVVASGGVEAVVLDQDSTGVVWVTYTLDTSGANRAVYVTHNTTTSNTFVPPYIIPVNGTTNLTRDDISAVVAYNGKIGVMWSNQNTDTFYFAIHLDGAGDGSWQGVAVYVGPHFADDHINLKSLQADPSGQVFAAIKTSLNDLVPPDPNAPLIVLLVLPSNGSWYASTFSRVQDNETRPLVLLDTENRMLYLFASSNSGAPRSAIYYKQSSLDNVTFPVGLGTAFIASAANANVNNATSTKQTLNGTTGLLVEASDVGSGYYLHNAINLPRQTATSTVLPATATTSAVPSGSPTNTPVPVNTNTPVPLPTASSTPCTVSFPDVHAADYFSTPVHYLACHGVISGYGDGTFRPYANTTRSQMVKIVVLGFAKAIVTPVAGGRTFADVLPSFPFFAVIETAAAGNIVSGYGCGGPNEGCDPQHRPYFRPYASVTRGQLAKIVVVAAGYATLDPARGTFADVQPNTAFYTFVETAVAHGLISGYSCGGLGEPCETPPRPYFRQPNPATRGQIAKIVYNAITGMATPGPATP